MPRRKKDETPEEIEETEEPEPEPKGRKRGKRFMSEEEQVERSLNGGPKPIPPKPPGVAAKVKARTFQGWVQSLCKRETPPHHFICELADGETKSSLLAKNKSGNPLVGECVSTIETFEPVKVEAFSRDADSGEEHSLGWWVFPVKAEPPVEETVASRAATMMAAIPPGFLTNTDDSESVSLLKLLAHLISDAYRLAPQHQMLATKDLLDSMSRVMEMQANAFAVERESMGKAMQAAERLAKIRQNNKFRVAAGGVPGASDVVSNEDDEEETAAGGEQIFNTMAHVFATELAKRSAGAASAAATEAASSVVK